ncbi:lytic transglycosylase domain-containing protein [Paracoccus methylovorus]|uniref:Lytic transglycosylase domain-containing protein n=1 Tax=Paracoccus methylovorus TaxID=2812658 RepID=A0ABX7JN11_9RHOB|nr:lytic transglycosylase domain-containing protein [Paracoccus methylovorus]QRZ15632.1 lytic transglycosylase domain-containing protein [Paracoccus methylovorus]
MRSRHPFHAAIVLSGWLRAARRNALLSLSGLLLALPLALPINAQSGAVELRQTDDLIAVHVTEAAQRFDIPEHWIRAVMQVESAGNSTAVSSAGAMGLMQIMPETWAALRRRHGLGDDPFAPRDNLLAGTAYLREMLDRYGNIGAMLAAYNAGPGRYDHYLSGARELPDETRAYVAALAPMLYGDGSLTRLATVAPRASDWREASLFVAQADGWNSERDPQIKRIAEATDFAADPQIGRIPSDARSAPTIPAHPHALAPADELFASRSSPGDAP